MKIKPFENIIESFKKIKTNLLTRLKGPAAKIELAARGTEAVVGTLTMIILSPFGAIAAAVVSGGVGYVAGKVAQHVAIKYENAKRATANVSGEKPTDSSSLGETPVQKSSFRNLLSRLSTSQKLIPA